MSEIDELREKVKERDNLLETMGIHLPDNPPMRWEYKSRPLRYAPVDGEVRCPNCRSVFQRMVGERYKH